MCTFRDPADGSICVLVGAEARGWEASIATFPYVLIDANPGSAIWGAAAHRVRSPSEPVVSRPRTARLGAALEIYGSREGEAGAPGPRVSIDVRGADGEEVLSRLAVNAAKTGITAIRHVCCDRASTTAGDPSTRRAIQKSRLSPGEAGGGRTSRNSPCNDARAYA